MTSHFRSDQNPLASFNNDTQSRIEDIEYEYHQRAKPLKALIGLGVLIAIVVALWAFNTDRPDTTANRRNNAITTDMNRAPGQTTGQTPARPAPQSSPAR